MARSTIADLIEAMPSNDAVEIAPAVEHLFALEDQIDDEFLGIAGARFVPAGSGYVIVTDARLILVSGGGGLKTVEYAEIESIVVGPGAKKLFGGYERSHALVYRNQGDLISLILPGDHDWAMRTMATAQRAHERYRLNGFPARRQTHTAEAVDFRRGEESVTLSPDQVRELDLLLTTLSVYAEARSNDDMVRRVREFTANVLRRNVSR